MSAGTIAEDLLAKLLDAGDKHAAGARARAPALTAMHLKPYRELRSWHQKQECDETFLAARDAGAVTLQRGGCRHRRTVGVVRTPRGLGLRCRPTCRGSGGP